jgi:hypothetical protein
VLSRWYQKFTGVVSSEILFFEKRCPKFKKIISKSNIF